jgi:hypothetical protein
VGASHEIIHEVAHIDQDGFIFKLDYEKAYDRVNREFLIKMMIDRGFSPRWIYIIKTLLDNGSVRVNLMMKIVNYFLLAEG